MRTLSIDVGGSGIKAMLFDVVPLSERIRVPTPRRATPDQITALVADVADQASAPFADPVRGRRYDRVSVGFPGVVVDGITKTAPNLGRGWESYPLQKELEFRLGAPTRVINDADMHGLAVIEGRGVEMVITLGTGMGAGLYVDGRCAKNLELGHHPCHTSGETYEERLSNEVRKRIGNKKWNARVRREVDLINRIFNPDRLYLGGGNAARLDREGFPDNVRIVDNLAGLLGGVRLWEEDPVARDDRD